MKSSEFLVKMAVNDPVEKNKRKSHSVKPAVEQVFSSNRKVPC